MGSCETNDMGSLFTYQRHPRAEQLRQSAPVKTADVAGVHRTSAIARFNAKVGLKVTVVVGTMWAAYLFTGLALFALPDAIKQGTYFVVVWLSSSFLQLVILPIIIVGQNIQAAAADKRAEETYRDAEAVLSEAEQIQQHLEAQDQAISDIVTRLESLVADVKALREASS